MKRLVWILCLILPAMPAAAKTVDRVILISVDGLGGTLLSGLLATDTVGDYANFQRLVDEGTATFNARTDFSHTVTLPNHTCMLTGRPVQQPAGQPDTVHHGYTANTDPIATDTLHNAGNPNLSYVASAFDVSHDHGLATALFASKSKFVIFDQSYNALNGANDTTGADDGRDKIDIFQTASSGFPATAAPIQAAFLNQLATAPPDFSFVHYRDPDSAGHTYGWGSPAWNNSVKAVDDYIGEVLDFVAAHPVSMGRTVVIVTADHGGAGTGHSNASDPAVYTVPFFVWGSYVAGGTDLYDLNPTRVNPGPLRPDYNGPMPIRNGDAGNLALSLLGLPSIAGSSIDAGQDLVASAPVAEVNRDSGSLPLPKRRIAAHPNPFNGRVSLTYDLDHPGPVSLTVYDMAGHVVRESDLGTLTRGVQESTWDGRDDNGGEVASGVYLVAVSSPGGVLRGKLAYVQ